MKRTLPSQAAFQAEPSRDELRDFGERIEARFGHERSVSRQDDLRLALMARMRATGSPSYEAYLQLFKSGETASGETEAGKAESGEAEWSALAPLLTVGETYFFRMPDHFRALAEEALPARIAARRSAAHGAMPTLRILSAGCASGEEAYSIRILIRERFPELASGWKVSITGVDLSEEALERARAGIYSEWSLRATSEERRRANFTPVPSAVEGGRDRRFRLLPASRVGVSFRRGNLLDDPGLGELPYDIIFCRNVLIYFSESAIRQTIARLSTRLEPGGFLFLGPAESLRGVSRNFHLCHTHEVFYYRRREHLRDLEGAAGTSSGDTVPPADGDTAAPAMAAKVAPGGTWYDAIQQSSSRLATLMRARSAQGGNAPVPVRSARPAAARPVAAPASAIAVQSGARGTPAGDRRRLHPSFGEHQAALAGDRMESSPGDASLGPGPPAEPAPAASKTGPVLDSPRFFALVAAERFAEALTLLDTSRDETATHAPRGTEDHYLLRAGVLVHLGRLAEAETECRLLLAADELHAGAHYLLGFCLEHNQEQAGADNADAAPEGKTRLERAREHMQMTTYLDPSFAMAHLHLGLLARAGGDAAAARGSLREALAALDRDEAGRLALFGGGFSRESLRQLCQSELERLGTA